MFSKNDWNHYLAELLSEKHYVYIDIFYCNACWLIFKILVPKINKRVLIYDS